LQSKRRLVGEEVLNQSSVRNALPKGAGKKDALKRNGYFERFPHRR
jgi:hypothetical protein